MKKDKLQKELLSLEILSMKSNLYHKLVQEKSTIDNNFIWDKEWLRKQLFGKKIEKDLKSFEVDTVVKRKTKLSELVKGDKIFGIGLSNGEVYFADYCDVRGYSNDNRNNNWDNISVGHETEPFGISTSIETVRSDKSHFLSNGSVLYFFTLTPELWEENLQDDIDYTIRQENKFFCQIVTKLQHKKENIKKYKSFIDGKISKD